MLQRIRRVPRDDLLDHRGRTFLDIQTGQPEHGADDVSECVFEVRTTLGDGARFGDLTFHARMCFGEGEDGGFGFAL